MAQFRANAATCIGCSAPLRLRGKPREITREDEMATLRPDPSFYPSPRMAEKAKPETIAYVAAFDPARKKPDAIAVVDLDPESSSYSQIVGSVSMPKLGD